MKKKLDGGLKKISIYLLFFIFSSNISYSSQILDYETEEFDFIWGDFHQTVENREEGTTNFLAKAPNIQAAFDEVASCQEVISYNTGQIPSS